MNTLYICIITLIQIVISKANAEISLSFKLFTTQGYSKVLRTIKQNDPENRILNENSTPIFGNSSSLNYYYVNIYIGNPPQRQAMIIDTGSKLTAFPCMPMCKHCGKHINSYYTMNLSNSSNILTCEDFKCKEMSASCNKQEQCTFSSSYSEGSSLSGVFIEDIIRFGDYYTEFNPTLMTFGCTTSENNLFYDQLADGIMGLSPKENSFIPLLFKLGAIPSKLFTLCLAPNGGYFTVGSVNTTNHLGNVTYIPYSVGDFYKVQLMNVIVNNQSIPIESHYYTIIDSGTTLTLLPQNLFAKLHSNIIAYCGQANRCMGSSFTNDLGICFRLNQNINTIQFVESLPTLEFIFDSNAHYYWKPENYLYNNTNSDNLEYCMGFVAWGSHQILLGGTWMHNHDIIFDMESTRIGIVESVCGEQKHSKPEVKPDNDEALNNTESETQEKVPCNDQVETFFVLLAIISVFLFVIIFIQLLILRKIRKRVWPEITENVGSAIARDHIQFQLT